MTQDKIIETAINAGFAVQADTRQSEPVGELRCDATTGHIYSVFWYATTPAIGSKVYTAPQPIPIQSVDEPFCWINPIYLTRNCIGGEFAFFQSNPLCVPLYTKPQPTIQDAADAEKYRWIKDNNSVENEYEVEVYIKGECHNIGHLDAQIAAAMKDGK